jgi:hydroxyethylthiazole kinase-like uncharacterized protein yjeF
LKREGDVPKTSCGRVLAIAGVVTLAVAQSLQDIMAVKLTEVMTRAVPEKEKGKLGKESLSALLDLAIAYDTVVIGPGLGRDEDTAILIRDFVAKVETQLVLDADAIVAFAGYAHLLRDCKITPILTPHLGEMAKLLGVSVAELREDRIGLTRDAAKDYNCIFVLKSERTIVVFPDGTVSLSTNGNPGMATAGSGDVLAGVIAGLKAQGMSRYNAAMAGVFLHGFAGDLAAERGMTGLVASDIMEALPAARFALGNE